LRLCELSVGDRCFSGVSGDYYGRARFSALSDGSRDPNPNQRHVGLDFCCDGGDAAPATGGDD
jgi:hypothetical protein